MADQRFQRAQPAPVFLAWLDASPPGPAVDELYITELDTTAEALPGMLVAPPLRVLPTA